MSSDRVIITGAFSYTGAAVAHELLRQGYHVHSLTQRRPPPETEACVSASPLIFDRDHLERELRGATALVNTYWIRLPHGGQSFASAVKNSQLLIASAVRAGVRRIVQISVSNASAGTNLGYYRGKAEVEEFVRQSTVSFAIVKPTLIVGPADVLTNNIAWFLRRFPLFPLPNGGHGRVQPITLTDAARIVVDAVNTTENLELDAAGPEVMSFRDYVSLIASACKLRRWLVSTPKRWALGALHLVELFLRDVVLTKEELLGLEQELLLSHRPALGRQSVSSWLRANGDILGRRYVNDRWRHFGAGSQRAILDPGSDDCATCSSAQ